ncbi:hypothetical protein EYD10_02920 [Varanus komodoensis]|nr:hypothetical protein EYD10_02920 [Varanus komodoensis]
MKPLGEIIRRCGLWNHQYADDTQLYLSFSTNPGEAVAVLNRCLAEVMGWMRANKLRLNPDKMEVLLVGGSGFGMGDLDLVLNRVALPLRDRVCSLGVLLDPELSLEAQVKVVARSAFLQLQLIHQLHPYLENDCLATVTHALTQFKVLVITYNALNGLGPGYLKEHLRPYMSSRPLRSAEEALLRDPSVKDIRRLEEGACSREGIHSLLLVHGKLIFICHPVTKGSGQLTLSTVQKWSSEFKRGRESTEDNPHLGGLVTATTKENVKKIEKLVLEDAQIKIKMLAEMTNLSVDTIFTIFHDHLNLSKICARWVPRMLMKPQKQVRVKCCREFLELCGKDPLRIFNRIVTGDETWVYHYDPESKQEPMQWHKKGADPLKKFAGKIMATVFWDSKGILMIEYTKRGETINVASYATTLRNLREAIKEKRQGKLTAGVLLLHNAPVHMVRVSKVAVRDCGFEEINHPPYSLDLPPVTTTYSRI